MKRCPACHSMSLTMTTDGTINCDNCKRRFPVPSVPKPSVVEHLTEWRNAIPRRAEDYFIMHRDEVSELLTMIDELRKGLPA